MHPQFTHNPHLLTGCISTTTMQAGRALTLPTIQPRCVCVDPQNFPTSFLFTCSSMSVGSHELWVGIHGGLTVRIQVVLRHFISAQAIYCKKQPYAQWRRALRSELADHPVSNHLHDPDNSIFTQDMDPGFSWCGKVVKSSSFFFSD